MIMEISAEPRPASVANLPVPIDGPIVLMPRSPAEQQSAHAACRIVGEIANEMTIVMTGYVQARRDRRRRMAHVRQIAMYVCHVGLRIPLYEIGLAYGRDPSTVRHSCRLVEDRRDDSAYDDFVSSIERMVVSVFSAWEGVGHA